MFKRKTESIYNFFEVFCEERPKELVLKNPYGEIMTISPYMRICKGGSYTGQRLAHSAWTKPTQRTIDFIIGNMIAVKNDSIFFELILFNDYSVLYSEYNLICGNRLISENISNESLYFLQNRNQL